MCVCVSLSHSPLPAKLTPRPPWWPHRVSLHPSASQPGEFCPHLTPPWGHGAVSGDILGVTPEGGDRLPAPRGQRPERLLGILQCTGQHCPPRTTQSYLAQTLPKLRSPENRTRFLCPKSISPLCKRHYLLSLTICPDTKPKSLPWFVPFPHSFFSHKFYLWLLGKELVLWYLTHISSFMVAPLIY